MRVVKLFEIYTLDLLFSFDKKLYICLLRLQLLPFKLCLFRCSYNYSRTVFRWEKKNYCVITDLHGKEHIPPEIVSRRGSPAAGDRSRVVGRRGVLDQGTRRLYKAYGATGQAKVLHIPASESSSGQLDNSSLQPAIHAKGLRLVR